MVKTFRPETLSEAVEILSKNRCTIIAGGTDLMVQKARGFSIKPEFKLPLLLIEHLEELKGISLEDSEIHIGACSILTDLMESSLIPDTFKEVIGQMASPPTRNLATIGGNLVNASPAGDTLPYLYAIDAMIEIQKLNNFRIIPIKEFITAPKKTVLQNDEILTKIIIPNKEFDVNVYRKLGQRKGMSLTKAAFHGMTNITDKKISDIRLAFGAVAPTIVRSPDIEGIIKNRYINELEEIISQVLSKYKELINPIDDARSTAKYRKEVCLRMLKDFLNNLEKK